MLAALTRYSAIDRDTSGTHHSRSAPPLRQVQYLLHLRTSAFAPLLYVLLQDPQNADCPARGLPPLLRDCPATRAPRRHHFLLRRGGHPRAPRPRGLHSLTPETFRPHPSQIAHAVLALWHFAQTTRVLPHCSSLQIAHELGTIRIASETVPDKCVSGLRGLPDRQIQ